MLFYSYDSKTKEYLGSEEAYLDPEETKVQGQDVYCLPANATFTKPPKTKEHQTVVFNDGWSKVADYRGEYIVNSDMNPFIYNKLGNLPDGYIYITSEQANKIYEDDLYYIIQDGELINNPNYEAEKAEQEQERISHLKCTKRVFVLMLEQLGLDYFEQIEPLINANRQAKLEWSLCVELERSNPLLNVIGAELNITPAQIDNLFKYANGEITQQDFIGE